MYAIRSYYEEIQVGSGEKPGPHAVHEKTGGENLGVETLAVEGNQHGVLTRKLDKAFQKIRFPGIVVV